MIITLNDDDIKSALQEYVKNFIGKPISKCEINITAGRGPNGYSADVELFFDSMTTPSVPVSRTAATFELQKEEPVVEEKPITGTLAEKVSNAAEGKVSNLNLFARED